MMMFIYLRNLLKYYIQNCAKMLGRLYPLAHFKIIWYVLGTKYYFLFKDVSCVGFGGVDGGIRYSGTEDFLIIIIRLPLYMNLRPTRGHVFCAGRRIF